ncbi:MAG: Asp-tRNA(Asn)/Glu-tRNA(Gln) amidotransferase subunit GatC [Lentisphaeria bacterium]|nr:Asp-tRNA(Asn)/Glu-tRNA(Gln) amidotransferase subunit GatC [Lentisphaeria bacterium]
MSKESTDQGLDVRYIADLARIDLSDEEIAQFQKEIADIIGYVKLLQEVDVAGIDPTAHAFPVVNVLREDIPRPSLPREAVLANAPATIGDDSIRVPAILPDEEEGA